MKRSSLIVPFFRYLFTKPSVIAKALYHGVANADRHDRVIGTHKVSKGLREVDLMELFPDFDETVNHFSHLYGTSFPIDIALLKKLARMYPECEYFEIGSWRGESIVNVAEIAKTCVSLSLSDKEMHSLGLGPAITRLQRFFSKSVPNIKHLEGNSVTFDYSGLQKFDLIFVDGDHQYEAVKSDTANAFKLLKNERSVIVWHDYTSQYELINWTVLAGILDGAPENKRGKIYHVTNTLCAIYIPWEIKSFEYSYPLYPNKKFTVRIKGEKL
jgi:hypothetical protein